MKGSSTVFCGRDLVETYEPVLGRKYSLIEDGFEDITVIVVTKKCRFTFVIKICTDKRLSFHRFSDSGGEKPLKKLPIPLKNLLELVKASSSSAGKGIHLKALDIVARIGPDNWLGYYNYLVRQPWLDQYDYPLAFIEIVCSIPALITWDISTPIDRITHQSMAETFTREPKFTNKVRKQLAKLEFDSSYDDFNNVCSFLMREREWVGHFFVPSVKRMARLSNAYHEATFIKLLPSVAREIRDKGIGDEQLLLLGDFSYFCERISDKSRQRIFSKLKNCKAVADIALVYHQIFSGIDRKLVWVLGDEFLEWKSNNASLAATFPAPRILGNALFSHINSLSMIQEVGEKLNSCVANFYMDNLAGKFDHYYYENPVSNEVGVLQLIAKESESKLLSEFRGVNNTDLSSGAWLDLNQWLRQSGIDVQFSSEDQD